MTDNEFETAKMDESMSSQEIQGEENHSEKSQKSLTLSTDESMKNNEIKNLCVNEQKISEITLISETKKNINETTKKRVKSSEYSEDPELRRIVNFLRDKGISENLIVRILKHGLNDGFDRLLRALGITNEEMKKFDWKRRFDSNEFTQDSSVSDKESTMNFEEVSMSPDNLYLKESVGRTLVCAMKDIVKRKPCDPVDFLGNWLIDWKVNEERENRRKEFEAELIVQREFSKIPDMDLKSEIIDYEKEESLDNDWNYGEYEESQMQ